MNLPPLVRIIQSFILREESGTLAPASYDEHKARHVKKGGVMATVFTGGKGKGQRDTEITYELSLEINRKMQSILEDTLLKNITLKVCGCVAIVTNPPLYYTRRALTHWAGRYRDCLHSYKPMRHTEDNTNTHNGQYSTPFISLIL